MVRGSGRSAARNLARAADAGHGRRVELRACLPSWAGPSAKGAAGGRARAGSAAGRPVHEAVTASRDRSGSGRSGAGEGKGDEGAMERQKRGESPRVTLDELLEKVDSKYTLVVLAARRARQLVDGAEPVVESQAAKPVTVALEELAAGKLSYVPGKAGIK